MRACVRICARIRAHVRAYMRAVYLINPQFTWLVEYSIARMLESIGIESLVDYVCSNPLHDENEVQIWSQQSERA